VKNEYIKNKKGCFCKNAKCKKDLKTKRGFGCKIYKK
jgi:hypothetical protein